MSGHPADLGVSEAAAALRGGRLTSEELTEACFDRITARDPFYSAWLHVYEDDALAAARAADARLRDGDEGPLVGIPIGLKDVIGVAGRPLTADSAVLRGNVSDVDSTVWARLHDAGMVLLGHLHCGEFACGTWGVNPWGDTFSPGGSSSGSGVALAARMVPATIGTDGRGSIRIPAAFMNLTAVKPSFGLVSTAGCIPITFTYDVVGPMARSAVDCALVLEAIAGPDAHDPGTLAQGVAPRSGPRPLRGARIGVPRFADGFLAEGVAAVWERFCEELADLGATLVDYDRPENPLEENGGAGAGWQTVLGAEALAIHAQFAERRDLHRAEFRALFDPMVETIGTAVEYVQAQMKRADLVRAWAGIFEELRLDAVVEPGSAAEVLKKEELPSDEAEAAEHPLDVEAIPWLFAMWNDVNFPVLSLPAGRSRIDGGPIGMQVVGLPFTERALLQIGIDYQAATDHHTEEPERLDGPDRTPFVPPDTPDAGPQPAYRSVSSPLGGILPAARSVEVGRQARSY
jgi:aspartyl-tRNA(Asn)/glutamyl-tRNA(Gln) amidotransferase subunit A